MTALALLAAALPLAAPAPAAPALPRGVDVSRADRALYALVTRAPTAAPRAATPAAATAASSLPAASAEAGGCALREAGSAAAPSSACLACHGERAHRSHPVDLDYGQASGSSGGRLRPAEEVVRRGLLLHEGRLHCTTCHDGASPWKGHLFVPPGSEIRPAVDPRDPATYSAPAVAWAARGAVPPGSDVARKALCVSCHALD